MKKLQFIMLSLFLLSCSVEVSNDPTNSNKPAHFNRCEAWVEMQRIQCSLDFLSGKPCEYIFKEYEETTNDQQKKGSVSDENPKDN